MLRQLKNDEVAEADVRESQNREGTRRVRLIVQAKGRDTLTMEWRLKDKTTR